MCLTSCANSTKKKEHFKTNFRAEKIHNGPTSMSGQGGQSCRELIDNLFYICNPLPLSYMRIPEKGFGDVVSAVSYTIYTIYLSVGTQTAEKTSPEPLSWIHLFILLQVIACVLQCTKYSVQYTVYKIIVYSVQCNCTQ